MKQIIKIAIAEDQQLFRKGVIALCNSFENFKVILEVSNGKILIEEIQIMQELPDVILIDLNMPEMDGIETTKLLKKKFPNIKTIILTTYNEDRFVLNLLEAGANAYLLKDCEPEELEKSILAVIDNSYYFTEHVLKILHENASKTKHKISSHNPFVDITEREKEILILICNEYKASEIAEKLFISVRTVEGHRNNLLLKTGCKNTAGLVIFAIRNGIFEINLLSSK